MSKKHIKKAILEVREFFKYTSFKEVHKKIRILELLNNALDEINKNDINIHVFIDEHAEVMSNCRLYFNSRVNLAEEKNELGDNYDKNLRILDAITELFKFKEISVRRKALAAGKLVVSDDEIRHLYDDIVIENKILGNIEETIKFFNFEEQYIISKGFPELLAFYITNAKRIGTYREALVVILKDKSAKDPAKKLEMYNKLYRNSISFGISTE